MSKTKKTTDETTQAEEKVEEGTGENVKDDKPEKEVHDVEDLKPSTDGVATGTMIENVRHDGVDYLVGTVAPQEFVELFRLKGYCK